MRYRPQNRYLENKAVWCEIVIPRYKVTQIIAEPEIEYFSLSRHNCDPLHYSSLSRRPSSSLFKNNSSSSPCFVHRISWCNFHASGLRTARRRPSRLVEPPDYLGVSDISERWVGVEEDRIRASTPVSLPLQVPSDLILRPFHTFHQFPLPIDTIFISGLLV